MRFYGNHSAAMLMRITLHAPQPVYLLRGPQGVGKHTLALRFARTLLCGVGGAVDCNCESCRKIQAGLHPDLILPTGENGLKKEVALEIRDEALRSPLASNGKVFIIDNADSMTPEGQNALLKTLEDCKPWNTFLLIDHSGRVLPTIESRSFTVQFQPATETEMTEFLCHEQLDPAMAELLISMSAGRIGRAKAIIIDERFSALAEILSDLFMSGDFGQLSLLNRFHLLKEKDPDCFYDQFQDFVPELVLALRAYFLDSLMVRLGGRPNVFRSACYRFPCLSPVIVGHITGAIDRYERSSQKANRNDFFDFIRMIGKSYEEGMRLAVS